LTEPKLVPIREPLLLEPEKITHSVDELGEDTFMAASATISPLLNRAHTVVSLLASEPTERVRRVDVRSGRALEILGHAIEYLIDEYAFAHGSLNAPPADLDAVQLLMSLNREIYYSCPVQPTMSERLLALISPKAA